MPEMKVIAMYLPQFHRLRENDEWWGEGFTEWTAVKAAEPLFEGHDQPRVPLNDNYYDLLDKETMKWQSGLMKKYSIYGMCFYHYWFKDGRKILEKPAENLLKWNDIDMPFCFSWANEPWTRTWSKLNYKNVWSSKFENAAEEKTFKSGVLLEQNYGEEKEWEEHFDYLLPFFQDSRYIKIENKPVFIFYRPLSIPCLERMVEYWRKLAEEAGFKGIYCIGTNILGNKSLNAVLIQEPQYTMLRNFDKKYGTVDRNIEKYIDGKELWKLILKRQNRTDEKMYFGGFSGYDDTPRRGVSGTVVDNLDVNEFYSNLVQLLYKNEQCGSEITFINAWNEWGEGMYLEPDTKNGYKYLETVQRAMENYRTEGACLKANDSAAKSIETDLIVERYRSYWRIFNSWLTLKEEGKRLDEYLKNKGYYQIAIYGIGMVGLHLVKELEGSSVSIKYGIDQRGNNIHQVFPVYRREDELPEADAVIVSVTYEYGEIYQYLKDRLKCPIISLEEVVDESLVFDNGK